MAKSHHRSVKMFFVIPNGCSTEGDTSDLMKMAFQEVEEADLSPSWLKSEQCLENAGAKNTVFVLQEFSGEIFEQLRKTKSVRLCGPMCIRSCIADGQLIPDNGSPVLTTAMRGVVLTASQLPPSDKKRIKEKVGFMGGIYMNNLVETVTHLVTSIVHSEKYVAANKKGIPIMKPEWVDMMLDKSQESNILATDPEIITKYKCPVFYNMSVACSNIPKKEKAQLRDVIIKNGGSYSEQLRQFDTTLLVVRGASGDKYKHARSWQVPCVEPQYIYDSAKSGYALPSQDYLVHPVMKCSTPTKVDENPNFSCTSDINISMIPPETSKTSIDETQATNYSVASVGSQQVTGNRLPAGSQHAHILETLTLEDAKKAGSFMDGCRIYLSGFTALETDKLNRILMRAGATIFSELTESVSHMLMGEFVSQDVKTAMALVHKPCAVSVDWVLASVKLRKPANEDPFLCLSSLKAAPEPPSPLSQKGLQLLTPETAKMPPPADPPVSRKLFSEFVKENISKSPAKTINVTTRPQPNPNNSSVSSPTSDVNTTTPDIFIGLKMMVVGFTEVECTADITNAVESLGGSVEGVNFTGVADYAIVPILPPTPNVTAVEVVTNLWVEDCIDQRQLLPVQYYHQPQSLDVTKAPLADCCISLSSYYTKEKAFLTELIENLGAKFQEVFARVDKEGKGVNASTHLVCPNPEGQKYNAAVRWGLPAVTKDWLHACAKQGSHVDITPYIVDGRSVSDMSMTAKTPVVVPETPNIEQSNLIKTPINLTTASIPSAMQTVCPSMATPTTTKTVTSSITKTVSPTTTKTVSHVFTTPLNHPTVTSLKRKSSAPTPEDLSPFHVNTPDTPYGQVFGEPTPNTKKAWKKCIDNFPCSAGTPPLKQAKRKSTPLSELMKKAWKGAVETSDDSFNSNYSIEDMNDEPDDSESNHLTYRSRDSPSMKADGCLLSTSARVLNTSSQSLKGSQNVEPRKVASGRGTPTLDDFKPYADENMERNNLIKSSFSGLKLDSKKFKEKKSPANEKASEVMAELQKRLSLCKPSSDVLLLPQRELVCPDEHPTTTQKPANVWPESQPILIGWDDPVESAERAKVFNRTSPADKDSSPAGLSPKHKRFIFSNVNNRERYEAIVKGLSQEHLVVSSEYDEQTTHLITDRPLRSEKLLCCIAAGKWVLHTSYVNQLAKCGGNPCPDEERYEWGNEASAAELPVLARNSMESELALAAVHWRRRRAQDGAAPFTGMRAVLVTAPGKVDSFRRLIEAGTGRILPSSSILEATHCFVDSNKIDHIPGGMAALVSRSVPCLPPSFLADLLTKQPPPSIQSKMLPEYKRLMSH